MSDFVIMGALLLATGFPFEFTLRRITSTSTELFLVPQYLLYAFLIWAELAVGLFGTEFAGT
jgi:uncharacterized membrane protein YdbT with pleckstrin-like domain